MAFRTLTSIVVRCNVGSVYRSVITSSPYVRRSFSCPNKLEIMEHVRVISPRCCARGYASKKKAKLKGSLKLSSLDENEAVDVEEIKQGMEDVLSGLRQLLTKLSVKVTPGEYLRLCEIT